VLADKRMATLERAFRGLKSVDLDVRPIDHRASDRVRAHVFAAMLSDYVEWHMRLRISSFALPLVAYAFRIDPSGTVEKLGWYAALYTKSPPFRKGRCRYNLFWCG